MVIFEIVNFPLAPRCLALLSLLTTLAVSACADAQPYAPYWPSHPAPYRTPPLALDASQILGRHNALRAALLIPPLRWSDALAEGAERWAQALAQLGRLRHSQTPGIGENLAMWGGANPSTNRLMAMWAREKSDFVFGAFPRVALDLNWHNVGHYTQIIWRNTEDVGCGAAGNGRSDFLVCWYSPPGNVIGQAPY